jgi:hypothetical protein
MQKLQCKTTFNSAFVGKKSSKSNKSRLWNNVFKKCGFYMKYIIVKNYSDRVLFARLEVEIITYVYFYKNQETIIIKF